LQNGPWVANWRYVGFYQKNWCLTGVLTPGRRGVVEDDTWLFIIKFVAFLIIFNLQDFHF
jgi:hypothetical protein